jgi:hypothetical protein
LGEKSEVLESGEEEKVQERKRKLRVVLSKQEENNKRIG